MSTEHVLAEGVSHTPDAAVIRARYPILSTLFSDRWMASQAALDGRSQSPLYAWVQPGDSGAGSEFLDDLAACVGDLRGTPGAQARVKRLVGPVQEFWAALCELKLAALLVRAGIRVTLHADTPDLRAHLEDGPVGLELTAAFPTLRFNDLQLVLTHAWTQNGRLILLCPDETDTFLTTERDRLVDRVTAARYDDLPEPVVAGEDRWSDGGFLYRDEGFSPDERKVLTDDIVDRSRLEVFVGPAPVPVVITRSGARWGYEDPWPAISEAAEEKARKLPTSEAGLIAFEGGFLHPSANVWARLVAGRHVQVELHLKAHVAGVLCYWADARRSLPVHSFFVWNVDFAGPGAGVRRVLAGLGIDSAPGPGDEDFR
jgi:hypothetical protein